MKKLLALMTLSISVSAFAGNGSSGGGNIYGDQLNPWFLQNTKTVNYCVEIAPEFSVIPRTEILGMIAKSFAFWKKAFTQSGFNTTWFPFNVDLGTQDFNYKESCSDTDLKFQLGSLTSEQKKELSNYRQLIGVAFRTSYDLVNLKGKGFIYIAPESGPLRPQSANLHPTPWSYGQHTALQTVINHELGHIFGLQDDHYSYENLMGAKIAEEATSTKMVPALIPGLETPSPLGCNARFEGEHGMHYYFDDSWNNGYDRTMRDLLDLPSKFLVRYISANGLIKIQMDGKDFGTIQLDNSGRMDSTQSDPSVSIYLTKKQTVFENVADTYFNTHVTIENVRKSITRKDEQLKLANGKTYNVFVQFDQQCMPKIGMSHDDKVYFDIFSGL